MTARPDIVLLVLDTQRADRLSCYGYGPNTSPHLDKLAQDATLFRQAYSTAQWTIPSHTSMFTGLYPGQHNMLHASSVLPETFTTLAERLGETGYFTSAFCNNPLIGVVNTGLQRGFHSFLNYGGLMTSRPHQSGQEKHIFDRYRHAFKRDLTKMITSMQDIFARSDTLLDLSFSPLIAPLWQTALSFKGNTAKSLQDTARLHIERKGVASDQPIFSFVNLMEAHMPYHPPLEYVARFAPRVAKDKSLRRHLRQFNSDVFGWMAPLAENIDEQSKLVIDGMYDAEVAYQDALVGNFIEQMRASGTLDHTFLIICADHGEHLGEKQLMGHSISLYNTLVHVPLIIRDPANKQSHGTTVEHVISTRRIFHTALQAAGTATPAEEAMTLTQEDNPEPENIYALGVTPQNLLNLIKRHQPALMQARKCDQPRRAVWHKRYKLIQTGEDQVELYDIINDPDELVNLSALLPEQVENLQASLDDFSEHANEIQVGDTGKEAVGVIEDPQVYRRLHDLGYLE